jgi:hypothetical protein
MFVRKNSSIPTSKLSQIDPIPDREEKGEQLQSTVAGAEA